MILGVYCAGGLGKEVVDLAKEINKERNFWQDILFVDDIFEGHEFYGHLVLSFEEFVKRSSEQSIEITIANGEPEVRRKLYDRCKESNLSVATLIHPLADISPSAIIGEGANSVLSSFTALPGYCNKKSHNNVISKGECNNENM